MTLEMKEYLLDGEPISWTDLIKAAKQVGEFQSPLFRTTSEAARILRSAGHTVEKKED